MGISQFERDLYSLRCTGFLVLPQVFSEEDTRVFEAEAFAWLQEIESFSASGGQLTYIAGWPLRNARALYAISESFQKLVLNDLILKYANAYLGKAVLRDCHLLVNMPDKSNAVRGINGDLNWHRDKRWDGDGCPPSYLHNFILLDDFTAENGGTHLIPGTHREREPGYYFLDNVEGHSVEGNFYKTFSKEYFPSSVQILGRRGDLVIFDPMVIHAQGINVTSRRRSAINVTFHRDGLRGLYNCRRIAATAGRVPYNAKLDAILESGDDLLGTYGPLGFRHCVNL
jgi:hypothetical protein